MADVFVSYSRRDKARVAPLVAAIQDRGYSVWWDTDVVPGQEFEQRIESELAAAAAVLAVWTPESVGSRWVRGEARAGADRGVLVPVRFDQAQLPIDMRTLQTIDLDGWGEDPGSQPARDLLAAIDALVGGRGGTGREAPPAPPPVPPPDRVAICVLPFETMSDDPAQAYFSDGISEDIITELSHWGRLLAVRPRSASFRYRGAAVDLRQVARDLQVDFIVEGSVRPIGDRIRVTAQLIDAESGKHVWAERFDRDRSEIVAVQDQLVRTIVSTLVGRVQVRDIARLDRKSPASLAAYQYVLKGNAVPWTEPGGAEQARRLFEKAIEVDPQYGVAYALLAALRYDAWYDDFSGSDTLLQEAYDLARRAVEADENDSTCFSILAQVCMFRRTFDLALQHAMRAIELNPSNQWNRADMGCVLTYLGRADDALDCFRQAREIDPYFDPPWYWRAQAEAYMVLHREAEALAMLEHLSARRYRLAALRAACHARLGHREQARAQAAECLALKPDFTIARFMDKQPFQDPADAAYLAESLRMAGLPH